MGKFTGLLLASDYDNTLAYTVEAAAEAVRAAVRPRRRREPWESFQAF